MAAPFATSYNDTLKRDLRHIYSGRPVSEIPLRTSHCHDGIDLIDRIHMQQTRPRVPTFPTRSLEYLPKYDIYLPKAHGFQKLSRAELDDVIARLHYSRQGERNAAADETNAKKATSQSAPPGGRRSKKSKNRSRNINSMSEKLHSTKTNSSKSRENRGGRSKTPVATTESRDHRQK